MKEPVYIEGTVEEVSDEGAVTKLSDGRTAIVPKCDYFLEAYTRSGFMRPGREVMVRELGPGPKGEVLIGLQPMDFTSGDTYGSIGSDARWVTSLEEVRGECPDEVAAVERHRLFLVGPTQRRSMRRICFRSLPEVHEFISRDLKDWRQGH